MTLYEKVKKVNDDAFAKYLKEGDEYIQAFENGDIDGEEWDLYRVATHMNEARVAMTSLLYIVAMELDVRDDLTEIDINNVKAMLHEMVEELI